MEKKKHFCINCSLIKVHGNISAVYEYLVDHRFITDCDGMPDGMVPYGSPMGAVSYAFRNGVRVEIDAENGEFFSASAPVNTDGDYIMLLVNANATDTSEEYGIMRRALCAYVATLAPASSPIVLHLDGWLTDAFRENGEEHALPGGNNVEVVDSPYYGDRVKRIQENISIKEFDRDIEGILMETLDIAKDKAKFDHAFDSDTKGELGLTESDWSEYDNYFTYRGTDFSLQLVSDSHGKREMKIRSLSDSIETVLDDIHDLKKVIEEHFIFSEKCDTPAEPVETAKTTAGKPTFASLMDDFTRRMKEIVSRTPEGEDWLIEFNEVASPREIVGYYLYTYGLSGTTALDKWKANTKGTDKTKSDKDVDEIFDAIFCPFCEQRNAMEFGNQEGYLKLNPCGTVDCYPGGMYQGTFKFPNCPQCGKPIETK